ncbi:MAG: hypothetical protein H7Z12_02395 [Rhodospirillaceae bacterium]|nr:hypothetical protein [Rhodospirillales bacterium]
MTYGPALLLLGFSIAWTGGLMAWPRAGFPVAVLYSPAMSGAEAFAGVVNAGADTILGIGALPGIVVARSDDPGFTENLFKTGAWMVVRAPAKGECLQ